MMNVYRHDSPQQRSWARLGRNCKRDIDISFFVVGHARATVNLQYFIGLYRLLHSCDLKCTAHRRVFWLRAALGSLADCQSMIICSSDGIFTMPSSDQHP